ncbi:MAG: hypothetical protein RR400_01740 [Clostridia bacterium]
MKGFVKGMDGLALWAKILLALPVLDIVWVVYRLVRSISKKNTIGIVFAIILIVVGLPILWLIDMITIIVSNKVVWVD